jgi:hypothetical protein
MRSRLNGGDVTKWRLFSFTFPSVFVLHILIPLFERRMLQRAYGSIHPLPEIVMLKSATFRSVIGGFCLLTSGLAPFRLLELFLLAKKWHRQRYLNLLLRRAKAETVWKEAIAERCVLRNKKLAREIDRDHRNTPQ